MHAGATPFRIASGRRRVCALLLASVCPLTLAQQFPSRPIRIIVPFGPGGVTDVIVRLLAEGMARRLGSPVIVENKPGAGSVVGMDLVAKALPDGYTVLMGANTSFTINPNLQKRLPYDVGHDFTVVAPVFTVPIVLLARPEFPANTLDELSALARREPTKLSYGSFGQGSSSHLAMEWLKTRAGIELVHVPYAGGAAATQALLGGQVSVSVDALTGALPQLKAGKVKAISLLQNVPSTVAPEIPTTRSSHTPEIDLRPWSAMFAPAATPTDRVQKLAETVRALTAEPAFVARLAEFGATVDRSSIDELNKRMAAESAEVARVVRVARIVLD